MLRRIFIATTVSLAVTAAWSQVALPPLNAATEDAFVRLTAHASVKQAVEFIKSDDERTLKDQIELTEIPAPPFKESVRAADYQKRLKALGLTDARIDTEGNVIAVRKGSGNGPVLVVSAHLDTVFPEGTDVKVKINGNRYEAPGIYDDGARPRLAAECDARAQSDGPEDRGRYCVCRYGRRRRAGRSARRQGAVPRQQGH